MEDSERRSVKRSRFDQTEPEPKRASRFDRRSRSPPRRQETARERSPLSKARNSSTPDSKSPLDPAAAAGTLPTGASLHIRYSSRLVCPRLDTNSIITAAAAARINAQLQARKGIQHVDVPPVKSSSPTTQSGDVNHASANINGEMYISDGDYIKDIEVNDLRNRYLVTKGSTQKMVNTLGYLS